MRSGFVLLRLLLAATCAQACVVATCGQVSGQFQPPALSVRVYDNGRLVCEVDRLTAPGVQDETLVEVPCLERGISARVAYGCGRVEYSSGDPDFYSGTLEPEVLESEIYCCGGCCPPPGQVCGDPEGPEDFNCQTFDAIMNDRHPTCQGVNMPQMCGEDRFAYVCRGWDPNGPTRYPTFRPREPVQNGPSPPNPDEALRIMIVGDSMTHAAEGDYSWRYRIWSWLRGNRVNFRFVGPYQGVQSRDEPRPPQPPSFPNEPSAPPRPHTPGGYARDVAAEFLNADYHFSSWGYQVAQAQAVIQRRVEDYKPDYILVKLGFNDMGWFISDDRGTLNSMRLFVENARRANPNVRFLIGNVVHRTFIGGREDLVTKTNLYNRALPDAIASWTTERSPIRLVNVNTAYSCSPNDGCTGAYDGLHPGALGEYQIARAFSLVMQREFGIGSQALAIPANIPGRDLSVPGNIVAAGAPMGVRVTWNHAFGCAYNVRSRIVGTSDWSVGRSNTNRFDTTFTVAGINWEYQVASCHGDTCGAWSGTVSATARRDTAPPPRNISVRAIDGGVSASWRTPEGSWDIDRYEIMTWNRDCVGCFISGVGARGLSGSVTGLQNGALHQVWMRTWTRPEGGGFYESVRPIRPGSGNPAIPTNFQARNIEPMGTTISLTWNAAANAAGYLIYIRNINEQGSQLRTDGNALIKTDHGIAYLWPGTWNYEFCVSAVNGDLESGRSNCVIPEKPPGF